MVGSKSPLAPLPGLSTIASPPIVTSGILFPGEILLVSIGTLGIGCNNAPNESVCVRLGWGKVELSRRTGYWE